MRPSVCTLCTVVKMIFLKSIRQVCDENQSVTFQEHCFNNGAEHTRLDVWTDEQNKLTAMMHFVTEVIASNVDVKRSKFKVTVK